MKRFAFCGFLVAVAAASLFAQSTGSMFTPGEIDLVDDEGEWVYWPGNPYMVLTGWLLIDKAVPYAGPGRFIVPKPNEVLFHDRHTMSLWDGVVRFASEPGNGYSDLFTDDAELGEIAPMRSGHFLVAERWADPVRGAKLIEFDFQGRIGEHAFPSVVDPGRNVALGAEHFELLSDQCTVLYTLGGYGSAAGARVRRVNICRDRQEPDFAVLRPGQYGGAIRQLRSGEVVVANGDSILRFTPGGELVRSYELRSPGSMSTAHVTHLTLSPDGSTCFAAGIQDKESRLYRLDPYGDDPQIARIDVGNPQMRPRPTPTAVAQLVLVGEWRSAALGARVRAVRHR